MKKDILRIEVSPFTSRIDGKERIEIEYYKDGTHGIFCVFYRFESYPF